MTTSDYSWIDETLFKLRTTREVEHNDNQWTTEFVYSLDEAKQTITAKLAEIEREARIDELRELAKSIERIEDSGTDTGMSWWVEDRIAALKHQGEKP